MTNLAPSQLDRAVGEVLSGRPVRATARKFGVARSTLVRRVEAARTSTPNGDPPIPLGAILGPGVQNGNGAGKSLASDLAIESEDSLSPVPPPGAILTSPIEVVLHRLSELESTVLARAALDGIPANVFDDLLEDEPDDELKGRKPGSPTEG